MKDINYASYIINNQSDKIAVIDDDRKITYVELGSYVRKFAHHLIKAEILPGDRIVISMQDRFEWIVGFLGCLYMGAVPVVISPFVKPVKFNEALQTTRARAAIYDDPDLGEYVKGKKFLPEDIFREQVYELVDAYMFDPDEIGIIATSSGTTGKQKYVVHRHKNLSNYHALVVDTLEIDQYTVLFSTAKLSFVYGLNLAITASLGQGGTTVLTKKKLTQNLIVNTIKQHNVTHFFTTPGVLGIIVSKVTEPVALSSIKLASCCSEPYPSVLAEKFKTYYGYDLINGYGMSETLSMICSMTRTTKQTGDSRVVGKPFPGVTVEIRNEQGEMCKPNEVGELYVNHPCMATFYWNNWTKTKETFQGQWVKSNDLVFQNDDGDIVYICRKDDMVKINGILVSIIEVEKTIMEHPLVEDCVVTVEKNNIGLAKLGTKIIPKQDNIDITDIRHYLSKILESCKIPKYIELVEEIPIELVTKIERTVTDKKIRFV
jgi:benzoate-CoA ligase